MWTTRRAVTAWLAVVCGIGVADPALAKGKMTASKAKYIQPQDRADGPKDLVVVDDKATGKEVDLELQCKMDIAAAKKTHVQAINEHAGCLKKRERYIQIQNPEGEAVSEVQNMCPAPVYHEPACQQCGKNEPCRVRYEQVKLWRACRREQIQEGERAGLVSEKIDEMIRHWCGKQVTLGMAYALIAPKSRVAGNMPPPAEAEAKVAKKAGAK